MQKDTHKVKSYVHVCKVPPQCSPVLTKTHNAQNERKILLWVFSIFILIHPETYFIRVAPPLNCGGTPPQCQIVCFYSHNVAVVRHTHTHTHINIIHPSTVNMIEIHEQNVLPSTYTSLDASLFC